ncbi:PQQ-binding-like beta-propeller repeat protein [Fimbriimonas ginsengisoli]|uniref:Pyrrolo-quinoline quinone n=1 Tax=Fimbriimonas ginsengisoli Gsoil 348 TaxID=661478 RepID=A0A068NTG2_FIMGI|nr:PQQ-binding-like beta-propeller repeat protein [Fimbriimonas ginsengisoli]AIE86731.1 Pyrrolo-quinoline quinone [Fimbriimonas ginsengisoli Gsoil 348]
MSPILSITLAFLGTPVAHPPATFRFDPAHTGSITGVSAGAYGGMRWRIQTEGTVRSTPAEYDGTVYIGAGDGRVRAIDALTGSIMWQRDVDAPVTSSPAVTAREVVVVTQDGRVVALDRQKGEPIWNYKIGPDAPVWQGINGDYWTSSATVSGDVAYVGGGNGDVIALDVHSGTRKWKFHAPTRFHTTPAVANGMVYLGGFDGVFYAIGAETGILKWSYRTLGATLDSSKFGFDRKTIQSSAAVSEGKVYFGARDGLLYCLNARTGAFVWSYDHVMSWVNTSPAVADGVVYAGSSDKRFLQAVNAETGKEIWRVPTGLMWTSPAVAGSEVFSTDGDGRFIAFDRKTGARKWEIARTGQIWTSPFLSGDHGIFGSDDGGIYCFKLDSHGPIARAVYWDDAERTHTLSKFPAVRDALVKRGYQLLNNAGLADFFRARTADHRPSAVVMATGFFPEAAPFEAAKSYMAAGGKVVWCGIPPKMWPIEKTGQIDMADIDWDGTRQLMGVQPRTIFDSLATTPTPTGQAWGLHGMWLSDFAADPSTVTQVLAKDDHGFAAVWVKSFGGAPGSGFVRMSGMSLPEGPQFIDMLVNVAETFPGV